MIPSFLTPYCSLDNLLSVSLSPGITSAPLKCNINQMEYSDLPKLFGLVLMLKRSCKEYVMEGVINTFVRSETFFYAIPLLFLLHTEYF